MGRWRPALWRQIGRIARDASPHAAGQALDKSLDLQRYLWWFHYPGQHGSCSLPGDPHSYPAWVVSLGCEAWGMRQVATSILAQMGYLLFAACARDGQGLLKL